MEQREHDDTNKILASASSEDAERENEKLENVPNENSCSAQTQPQREEVPDIRKLTKNLGNTPLMNLDNLPRPHKYLGRIFAKCEFRNPSGSIWDRFVVQKVDEAKENGNLSKGTYVVTGGNTELCKSLAWAGATGNFPVAVLPDELKNDSDASILKAFGANVILSFSQDPLKMRTMSCLKNHIKLLQDTSGISYYPVLPSNEKIASDETCFKSLIKELVLQSCEDSGKLNRVEDSKLEYDMVVFAGDNKYLINELFKNVGEKCIKAPLLVGALTSFEDIVDDQDERVEGKDSKDDDAIKWITVKEAEAYDMTRRLLREEGLQAGPLSGAIMAAALKAIEKFKLGNDEKSKVLVIFPDSLPVASAEFLSTDWMVQKGFYNPAYLESLFWWYEMAIENVSPPVSLIVTAGVPVKTVWKAMTKGPKAERGVVISNDKTVIGVVTYESLISLMNSAQEEVPVENICYKQFGIIDSKASFPELETLLRKYYWIINVHRLNYYADCNRPESPQIIEEIIGAVNLADFIKYKRKVENHHLTEFGIAMSDGVPTDTWIEKFKG